MRTRSGIWFRDLPRSTNLPAPLDGWYSPEGLKELARRDLEKAEKQLRQERLNDGFQVGPYQRRAIEAAEGAISDGQREILLAMATGTGKTTTCIALLYRLLKTGRLETTGPPWTPMT